MTILWEELTERRPLRGSRGALQPLGYALGYFHPALPEWSGRVVRLFLESELFETFASVLFQIGQQTFIR
jgi:hypothetical protein